MRGAEQELYVAFSLIAVSRLFANPCKANTDCGGGDLPDMRANFKNGMRLLGREIEAMFLAHCAFVSESVARITAGLSRRLKTTSRDRPPDCRGKAGIRGLPYPNGEYPKPNAVGRRVYEYV
ncbi:MAG: hypothetical protein OXI01_16540 [Albidovulum sp.]|nr:hypothetical protein [Albidovulum sp.]